MRMLAIAAAVILCGVLLWKVAPWLFLVALSLVFAIGFGRMVSVSRGDDVDE
jgi:hypothetical protein